MDVMACFIEFLLNVKIYEKDTILIYFAIEIFFSLAIGKHVKFKEYRVTLCIDMGFLPKNFCRQIKRHFQNCQQFAGKNGKFFTMKYVLYQTAKKRLNYQKKLQYFLYLYILVSDLSK